MTNQPPQDPIAYRVAVGAIGLALVAFLIGAAVISSSGDPVPTQYWAAGAGLSGALLGILAPSPQKTQAPSATATLDAPKVSEKLKEARAQTFASLVSLVRDIWNNRGVVILLAVFGVSLAFALSRNSAPLESVAAASGGALIGLLAPSPPKE